MIIIDKPNNTRSIISNEAALYFYRHNFLNLKISVKKSGCAGFKYELEEYAGGLSSSIVVDDISIYYDEKDFEYLKDLQIDLDTSMKGVEKIVYINLSKDWCGCNESFT